MDTKESTHYLQRCPCGIGNTVNIVCCDQWFHFHCVGRKHFGKKIVAPSTVQIVKREDECNIDCIFLNIC